MNFPVAAVAGLVGLLLVALVVLAARSRRRSRLLFEEAAGQPQQSDPATPSPDAAEQMHPGKDIPFEDGTTAGIVLDRYELSFGTLMQLAGADAEHAEVLKEARASIGLAITDGQYFPRRPTVIPQLLRAVKSNDGAVKDLVNIIMQDPVLTGDVLKTANSAYYRTSGKTIDTLGLAVVSLGTDGLRALVASSLLRPVFKLPRGSFDSFSETTWDLAFKSAHAAQTYARRTRSCDSFTAHLTALLIFIGSIVLFRLTTDKYTQRPKLRPSPKVFITLLEESADKTSRLIAEQWELPAAIQSAIEEHIAKTPVNEMSPLARAVYYGRLCGICALLFKNGKLDAPTAKEIARQKGLEAADFDVLWQAITVADGDATRSGA